MNKHTLVFENLVRMSINVRAGLCKNYQKVCSRKKPDEKNRSFKKV